MSSGSNVCVDTRARQSPWLLALHPRNSAAESVPAMVPPEDNIGGSGDEVAVPDSSATVASPTGVMSERSRRFVEYASVGILFFINLINYMDRYTVAGVLDQVIDHYKLMNSQGGLLQTVFVITYMLTAPVFGYLGDRHSRRAIMAAGVFFWSATTLLGSIPPKKFVLFALLRGLVGIGEASYSTVAPTVIGDLFSGPRRSKMLAVFYFAIPVGSGLGYIVGASVAEALHGWYWALRVTPVLGAVAVLLVLFVLREPLRGASEGATTMGPSTLKDDLFSLIANRSYIWSTLGFTCVTFATGALAWWAPSYMTHALQLHNPDGKADEGRVNRIFGIITTLAGIVGVTTGSALSSHFRKWSVRADAIICGSGMLISVPLLFVGAIIAHRMPNVTWVLFFFGMTAICLNWSIIADILLYILVPSRRATGAAFQILTSHLLGDASSPYIVGVLYDAILAGRTDVSAHYYSLQYALFLPVTVLVLGSLFFVILSWHIVADRDRCTALTRGQMDHPGGETDADQSLPNVAEGDRVYLIPEDD
ncbi:protein spinster homolog 3-like isoform X2 [Dermacentor silvarum]|uniref:protein spinster homolog 3-like isoform X2 n=1 Tax=Dermacentor silvarum TaxID=543639 RepID=UPI001896EEB6|nr:protein spinster homolog 3-like isoform X2 [Dermacentor silvarum]